MTERLIIDSVQSDCQGIPLLLGWLWPADDYLRCIAEVCRWCSTEPLENVPEKMPVSGTPARIRLLVALLRLADQLYIDSSRVNLDLLQRANLRIEQFARWWVYHYVQTLPIENGQIPFCYSLPSTQQDHLAHIRALIEPDFEYDNNPSMRYLWDVHQLRLMPHRTPIVVSPLAGFQREISHDLVTYLRVVQYVNKQYDVERICRTDSYFQVAKAQDKILNRTVAIKSLRSEQELTDDVVEQLRENLLLEAQILWRLDHPGIVQVYTIIPELWAVVQEWVYDFSLQDALDEHRQLSANDVISIGISVADALGHIHERGVIHRNIKPGNIMLAHQKRVVVVDFSIAHSKFSQDIARRPDGSYGYVGTPAYSAPEQISSPENVRTSADMFALGVVLYELLTHQLPYRWGSDLSVYDGCFPIPERFDIPGPLYQVLCSLLDSRPERRPTSKQLHDDLKACLDLQAPNKHTA